MDDFLETLAFVLIIVAIAVLFFIFQGSPDLWDKWHDRAMGQSCPVVEIK